MHSAIWDYIVKWTSFKTRELNTKCRMVITSKEGNKRTQSERYTGLQLFNINFI